MSEVSYYLAGPETVKEVKKRKSPVKKFTMGVIEKITANVLFAGLAALFAVATTVYFTQPTVPVVYVDEETGCEYLTNGSGLTPRLDKIGFQICRD